MVEKYLKKSREYSRLRISLYHISVLPATNLNNDENGKQKTITVNGCLRDRISSQALTYAQRNYVAEKMSPVYKTRNLFYVIKDVLMYKGIPQEKAEIYSELALKALKLDVEKGRGKGEGESILFSQEELETLINIILEKAISGNLTSKSSKKEKDEEQTRINTEYMNSKPNIGPVIAMYGRMAVGTNLVDVNSSRRMSNTWSLTPATEEEDIFTCKEDFIFGRGSSHINTRSIGSPMFNFYQDNDLTLLLNNLVRYDKITKEIALQTIPKMIGAWLYADAFVLPETNQTRMYSAPSPLAYGIIITRNDQCRTLDKAFLKPIEKPIYGPDGKEITPTAQAIARFRKGFNEASRIGNTPDFSEMVFSEEDDISTDILSMHAKVIQIVFNYIEEYFEDIA